MTARLRVFVSSVQKELEDERVIVQNLLNTDPFLSAHCLPLLYEFEPASPDRALEGCLKAPDDSSSNRKVPAANRKPNTSEGLAQRVEMRIEGGEKRSWLE